MNKAELLRKNLPAVEKRIKSLALIGTPAETISSKVGVALETVLLVLNDLVDESKLSSLHKQVREKLDELSPIAYIDVINAFSEVKEQVKSRASTNIYTSADLVLKSALQTLVGTGALSNPANALRALTVIPNLLTAASVLEDRASQVVQPKKIFDEETGELINNPEHSTNKNGQGNVILLGAELALKIMQNGSDSEVIIDGGGNVTGVKNGETIQDMTPLSMTDIDNMVGIKT